MKTTREWLNELPEPYNELAVANVISCRGEQGLNANRDLMSDAVNCFNWGDSPQRHAFWERIYDYYIMRERIPRIQQEMTNNMLNYYNRIDEILTRGFPDSIAMEELRLKQEEERRIAIEEQRIELQRQIDERVVYSESFRRMLDKLSEASLIADRLLTDFRVANKEANYISMRGEMCSFLPAGREHKTNPDTGRWLRDSRQEMKPAKLARKLLIEDRNDDLDATDYEKFTNAVKSYISVLGDEDGNGKNIRLELVNGNDIKKYYHWRNYSELMGKDTNLWGSCMRSEECQGYFEIYTENASVCSLLVALDNDGKVLGRALVWTFTDGKRGMDTIYAHESLFESFITWAVDNQAYYKDRQSCHHQSFDKLNRGSVSYEARVKLAYYRPDEYPYMDTLSILTEYGMLMTDVPRNGESYKTLRDTGGGYEDGEDDDDYVTLETGGRCHVDDCTYLDYRNYSGERIDGYYHESQVVFTEDDSYRLREDCLRINGDWYEKDSDDIRYVEDRDEWYLVDDTVFCDDDDEYHHIDDCKELHDGTWALEDNCNELHDGSYALNNDCIELHDGSYALGCDCTECALDGHYYLHDDISSASDGECVATCNLEDYEESIKEQLNENENETATY